MSARYVLADRIGAGGMATVHLGIAGDEVVAIKALHPHIASDPRFVAMLVDEARLAQRVRHPNVVTTLDIAVEDGDIRLVMEYVHGPSLAVLFRLAENAKRPIPVAIACKIMGDVLSGLHAAHEARDARGADLGIVHRDVSPANIIVATDGAARVLDFGIALAENRLQQTPSGVELRGKLSYMAPEQLSRGLVDRRVDVYATSVALWELLTGKRLFGFEDEASTLYAIMSLEVKRPSEERDDISEALDAVVLQGLDRNPAMRFSTALEMLEALDSASPHASEEEVAAWMQPIAHDFLHEREQLIARAKAGPIDDPAIRTFADGDAESPSPAAPARAGHRRLAVFAAVGALSLTALSGIGLLLRSAQPREASTSSPMVIDPPHTRDAITEPPSATSSSEPIMSARPETTASAEARRVPVEAPFKSRPVSTSSSTKRLPPECATPYKVDARGFKRYNPACL